MVKGEILVGQPSCPPFDIPDLRGVEENGREGKQKGDERQEKQ